VARSLARSALWLVGYCVAVAAGLAAIAGIYLAVEGGNAKAAVATCLFGGAAVLIVFASGSGGGAYGRRFDARTGARHTPNETAFAPSLVGVGVIGIGVLTVWLWP
jgi:hypothetical protein